MSILYNIFESFGEPCDTLLTVLTVLFDKCVCLANRAHILQLLTVVNNNQSLAPGNRCVVVSSNKSFSFGCHNTPSPRDTSLEL